MSMSRAVPDEPAPAYRRQPLRIACCQYDPKLKNVEGNARKVREMTAGIRPGSLDLLVLPEMCLSGYIYTNPASIVPYLEPSHPSSSASTSSSSSSSTTTSSSEGPTLTLFRSLANRLKCHIIGGYPERGSWDIPASLASYTPPPPADDLAPKVPDDEKVYPPEEARVGWNSALVVGPKGEVLGNYRKSFLYYTDKNWAREGDGFKYFDLPAPIGRVALGICMDMNPKDFTSPFDAYELARFVRKVGADVLVVPMNWLNPPEDEPPASNNPTASSSSSSSSSSSAAPPPPADLPPPLESDPDSPEESTLNYWAWRLSPLHDPSPGYGVFEKGEVEAEDEGKGKEVVFVACNRVGVEEGTKFVGTSCVMTVESQPKSRIELVEVLGRREETVLFATVN